MSKGNYAVNSKITSLENKLRTRGIRISRDEIKAKLFELCPEFPDDYNIQIDEQIIANYVKPESSLVPLKEEGIIIPENHSQIRIEEQRNPDVSSSQINNQINIDLTDYAREKYEIYRSLLQEQRLIDEALNTSYQKGIDKLLEQSVICLNAANKKYLDSFLSASESVKKGREEELKKFCDGLESL